MVATEHQTVAALLDRIIDRERDRFRQRMTASAAKTEEAQKVLAGGVTSSWQISDPHPIWIERGTGSRIFDVDGNAYVDYHGGYGAMLAGHAHPAITRAITDRLALGTHFAQPVEDAVVVATELASRYGQPLWRFGNSGTEATMDAVHLMRAHTGRDVIIKFEGAYHGHHDSVQVSTWVEEGLGDSRHPLSVAGSVGIPDAIVALTRVAPFNDLEAVEMILAEQPVAGVIVEPVLMNCGIVPPEPGFLEGLRALTQAHGALLTFDEVKTGLTLGRGGATVRFGVTPDLICLAKALGGGTPVSALGGSAEVMGLIVDGRYDQVGTFNGNPLGMAAARAISPNVQCHRSADRHRLGQPIGDDDHRAAGLDDGSGSASFGRRSWSSTLHDTIGPASASMNRQNPPVGRYFSRRSVSMWWRSTVAWYACVAARHSSKRGVRGRRHAPARSRRAAARGAAARRVPVEVGPPLRLA